MISDITSFEEISFATEKGRRMAAETILVHPNGGQDILEMLGLTDVVVTK